MQLIYMKLPHLNYYILVYHIIQQGDSKKITENHKVSQSQERMSMSVWHILFLRQFRTLSKLRGYIKPHPSGILCTL